MATSILPPKLRAAPSPYKLLSRQKGVRLSPVRSGLFGKSGPTSRFDVLINDQEVATIEYPGIGYPALVITGIEPFWRYNNAYSPEELETILSSELARDPRFQ